MDKPPFTLKAHEVDMSWDTAKAIELVHHFCDTNFGYFEIEYTEHKDFGDHPRAVNDFVVTVSEWDHERYFAKTDDAHLSAALLKALKLCILQLEVSEQWQAEDLSIVDELSAADARNIIREYMTRRQWTRKFDLALANRVRKALKLAERPDLREIGDVPEGLNDQ